MLITTRWRNGWGAAVTEMQGNCLQSKALTAGDFFAMEVWLPWQPVFSWMFALWRTHLYLLLCFETFVLQKNNWQEYFQSCVTVESKLCFWSQEFVWWWGDDGYGELCGWIEKVLMYLLHEVSCWHGREKCYCWWLNPGIALKDTSRACLEFAKNFVHSWFTVQHQPPAERLNWSNFCLWWVNTLPGAVGFPFGVHI